MSSSRQFDVFVIIVTYNGSRWVDKCLGSLRNSIYPVKTIVVDNSSTDDTTARIESLYPEVQLIKSSINHGFGLANNMAMREALSKGANFVFLLNQDAWIESNTVGTLVDTMSNNPEYGIVSPLHYGGSGRGLDFGFNQYLLKNYSATDIDQLVSQRDATLKPVDFINAAAWMLSRNTLEIVGGFGSLFRHYGEDRDYIQRLKFNKLKLGFVAAIKIFHDREGKSFDLSKRDKFVWYYYTGAITRLSDPGKSFPALAAKVFLWCAKDSLYYFLKGKLFTIPAFFEIVKKVVVQRNDILRHRETIKEKSRYLFIQ